ncbi:MAG: BREX system serine/threonine kinase PglW, partial [Nodosilinea sp.]
PLPDSRLLRLAAAASHRAALSSRQEFYPQGMEAERTLRLAQGALYGVRVLSERQLRERVSSRYPEAEPLPDRPRLDDLMQVIAPTLVWNPKACNHQGGYESRAALGSSIASSTILSRLSTKPGALDPQDITPEVADARQFEERLQRGIQDGSFLALLVSPQRYQRARAELAQRFSVQEVDYEGLFLDCLRRVADEAEVVWSNVLEADATPHGGNWNKLMLLVGRAMPLVEAELLKADRTVLLIYPALLARYQQMTLLERMRESIGRPGGIPGLWVLVPNDQQAMVEGQAVPLLSPGQRARIPEKWLQNGHRSVAMLSESPPTAL